MELVPGIDSFGRIPGKEVLIEFQSGDLLDHREAFFLGHSGIDGRFVDNYIALRNDLSDRLACAPKRFQVRAVVFIHRCRHCNHVEIAFSYLLEICRADKTVFRYRFLEKFVGDF